MGTDAASTLLRRAEQAWASGDGEAAMALFDRAADQAEVEGDWPTREAAVLGLARGQQYNLAPGRLPVRLYAAYDAAPSPASRARLAASLARCWAYANEPRRARPFAIEALDVAARAADRLLRADALDAALASHWGPDELARRRAWAIELDDAAAYLPDPDARLQAQLWGLTVAWEVLDLPRMHRCMRAIEQLAEESPRARFFAASRRLPLELLRGQTAVAPGLISAAEQAATAAVIPDADGVLASMRGYTALVSGDRAGCAAVAPAFEAYAVEFGVPAVRAEAAVLWQGADRPDRVAAMIGVFTDEVLTELPRDSDWLLVLQCVLEGAVAVADRQVAGSVLTLLAPYAGRSVVNAGAVMWHGVTDDTLAQAYALLGEVAASARHRSAALATYERVGALWWRDRLLAQLPDGVPDRVWDGVPDRVSDGVPDQRSGARSGAGPGIEPGAASRVVVAHLSRQPGGLWLVGREGATAILPAMRGLEHLSVLLGRPDVDVPAQQLAGSTIVAQDGLELLDEEGRRTLRAHLARLDAELEFGDRPELREERDAIVGYLAGATGLGGRGRQTGSHDERARVAVRKAIVAALARIAEVDPWLGRHLHERVRTGLRCRYEPDPDHPVRWELCSPSAHR